MMKVTPFLLASAIALQATGGASAQPALKDVFKDYFLRIFSLC